MIAERLLWVFPEQGLGYLQEFKRKTGVNHIFTIFEVYQ